MNLTVSEILDTIKIEVKFAVNELPNFIMHTTEAERQINELILWARYRGQLEALDSFHNQGVISGLSYQESVKQIYQRLLETEVKDES